MVGDLVEEITAVDTDGAVWDAFTGSSVVAQALAASGRRVLASDALTSSSTFASALLGIDRSLTRDWIGEMIVSRAAESPTPAWANEWIARETDALTHRDGLLLLLLGEQMPQAWRSGSPAKLSILNTYAGTYFGARQADSIDRIRAVIEDLSGTATISAWERSVAITALCSAASDAVFSAGKHFAQPFRTAGKLDVKFHASRALRDRSVDIDTAFVVAFNRIVAAARPIFEGHAVTTGSSEDVTPQTLIDHSVRTVYADPPYTAQQYSRFYHLLETITSGELESLDYRNGAPTRGLYPPNRHKSAFCSRRKAPGAFRDLARLARTAGANLFISYSVSRSGTGNARTVELGDLIDLVSAEYGAARVTTRQLDLRYRRFNDTASNLPGTADREVLLIGRAQ